MGETESLNGSWQWHLKKRSLRRRIAFQIFGFQTYLFATPSLLTICITSVLDWDSNKVYDLLALKNTSLGTSTQRCRGKAPVSHKDSPLLPEGVGVFRTPHRGQMPLPDLKEKGEKKLCLELAIPPCELHTVADLMPPAEVSQLSRGHTALLRPLRLR